MKKVMYLLATLLIGGLMLTGCKKDNPTPEPDPEPTPTTYKVAYKVVNSSVDPNTSEVKTMSPCFKLDMTYIDASGEVVTETNVTLPWTKIVEVTSPFHAKMEGTFSYNEDELPEPVYFGKRNGIGLYSNESYNGVLNGSINMYAKEKFLEIYGNNPEKLKFSREQDF